MTVPDTTQIPILAPAFSLSFQGDSALSVGRSPIGTRWSPYSLRGDTLILEGEEPVHVSVSQDTLVLTGIGALTGRRMTRLRAPAHMPRPERIGLSVMPGMSFTPHFDFEIDSSGTVHVFRYDYRRAASEGVSGRFVRSEQVPERPEQFGGRYGSYVGTGQRALFDCLSELVVELRADDPHGDSSDYDSDSYTLALWYGGRARVNSISHYDQVYLLISEIFRVARDTPMEATSERHVFEGI